MESGRISGRANLIKQPIFCLSINQTRYIVSKQGNIIFVTSARKVLEKSIDRLPASSTIGRKVDYWLT